MPSRHPSGRQWKDVAERRDVGGSIWNESDIDTCEDCGHKIGLTDTEGQYSGVCTKCRKKRGQSQYEHDNWLGYGTANWGGHWRYKKQEGDTDEEHTKKWVKARDEGRLGQ